MKVFHLDRFFGIVNTQNKQLETTNYSGIFFIRRKTVVSTNAYFKIQF